MTSFWRRLRSRATRSRGNGNPVLDGPVERTLLGLSVPMILAMLLATGYGLVDMLYLGRFGREAMAAVTLAFPLTYLIHTLSGAVGQAATSVCSRLVGAGDERQARNLLWHSLLLVAGLGVVLVPAGLLLAPALLVRMGAEPTVTARAITYTRIIYGGAVLSLLPMIGNSLLRGEGDTVFPFRVMAAGLGLNVVLDPLLIFGIGPLPRLGVAGAAWTTVVSFGLAAVLVLRELGNRRRVIHFDRTAWRHDPGLWRGLRAVALPALIGNLALPFSTFAINRLLAPLGTIALAAYGAGLRLLSFVFLPALGISLSMMIMVGQNHGAGRRDRAARATRAAVRYAVMLMAILALPVVLWPQRAMGIFTDDPEVVAAGVVLARWVTLVRPLLALVNITSFWYHAQGNGLMGMVPGLALRVVLEPLGVWLGLRAAALTGGWLGLAAADLLGGIVFGMLLRWRLRFYVQAAATSGIMLTAPPTVAPSGGPPSAATE